ncbi:hypothetical protein FQV27_01650 [Paracoccus aurantiacus]|uniref:Component of SufBCD complex n=1 Tax=Paracoccus aurantiacus TaxID=2599412 RepID=A0A5C6S914_9RHOB|nr:hypothetical protein [Paracoccus aurantiacus]TXB70602.1 hypothetical protein FQV27_01650 [Paracoccus aurantiacus]
MFLTDIISILDARSFSSPWFWLVLLAIWSFGGRRVLGIPADVLADAGSSLRRYPSEARAEVVALLDWMSLNVPRWRMSPGVGAAITALICFVLAVLIVLGFGANLEMAQAIVLLMLPQAILLVLRVRLAAQLYWVLEAAELGQPVPEAATEALRRINRYRVLQMAISLVAVILAAFWATRWIVLHPHGV